MLKTIKINYETIEMMLFYWESIRERQKVIDSYFLEIAEKPEMQILYNEEFTKESIRKVLSAIMNRERVNNPTKMESRFWTMNMWMLEDFQNMKNMLAPIKKLNVDVLYDELKDVKCREDIEIVFIPGHETPSYSEDGRLTVNFFKLMVDAEDIAKVNIDDKPLRDYVLDEARKILI